MRVKIDIETAVSTSIRARQVQASFDVPERTIDAKHWEFDLPIESKSWDIGLIVGPSGSGKSTIMRHVFGSEVQLKWSEPSVIDDFNKSLSVSEITEACGAVGFNTIPAWLRPFSVLSNGEKFRVELARRLLEQPSPIVVDEFTSLVDRQVARIASHAAQKYARRVGKKLIAVTCHYDVEPWLQPSWVLDVSSGIFRWRELQRRPVVDVEIKRVKYTVWRQFAPFHYLTNELNKSAVCYALHVNEQPVAFAGVLHFPHAKVHNMKRLSRLVTLPDWQGLGLAMILSERLGAAYAAAGWRFRTYPAHRALIRAFSKGPWKQQKEAGSYSNRATVMKMGERPCAVFEYSGKPWHNVVEARSLVMQ